MQFNPDSLVWAKASGSPVWPSVIIKDSSGLYKKGSGTSSYYFVRYFGDKWLPVWIKRSNLKHLRVEDVSPVLKEKYRAARKWEPTYSEAISQALGMFERSNSEIVQQPRVPLKQTAPKTMSPVPLLPAAATSSSFTDCNSLQHSLRTLTPTEEVDGNPTSTFSTESTVLDPRIEAPTYVTPSTSTTPRPDGTTPPGEITLPPSISQPEDRYCTDGIPNLITRDGQQYDECEMDNSSTNSEMNYLATMDNSCGQYEGISMDVIEGFAFFSASSLEQFLNIEIKKPETLKVDLKPKPNVWPSPISANGSGGSSAPASLSYQVTQSVGNLVIDDRLSIEELECCDNNRSIEGGSLSPGGCGTVSEPQTPGQEDRHLRLTLPNNQEIHQILLPSNRETEPATIMTSEQPAATDSGDDRPALESLPASTIQPALDVPGEIEIPLHPLPADHNKDNTLPPSKEKTELKKRMRPKQKLKPALIKCDHDAIIDANIAEKEAMLENLGIPSLKRKLVEDHEVNKRKRVGGTRKRKKNSVDYESTRKSSRNKDKKIDYVYPGLDPSFRAEPARRTTRPRKKANYNYDGPPDDAKIYCVTCKEDKLYGCEEHVPIFDYLPTFEICPSRAGRNSGRGVFNIDKKGIPRGVMMGPYKGKVYSKETYDLLKMTEGESGFAWELKDPETGLVNGYIDPGHDPEPENDYMSMVNCASKEHHQNATAVQYLGQMYYRVDKHIKDGEELLVYYGDLYALDINIDVAKRNQFEGNEDWEEEGLVCQYCGDGFATDECLEVHIEGGNGLISGCVFTKVDKEMEDVEKGLEPYMCQICGIGFKSKNGLKNHEEAHEQNFQFSCSQCEKILTTKDGIEKHERTVHGGLGGGKCPTCERVFISDAGLRKHVRSNCYQEKPYKCSQCGHKTALRETLSLHIRRVHDRQFQYKCQDCSKRFSTKSDLDRHIVTHNEDRPYKCDDCGKSFKLETFLRTHRKVHRDWSYLCFFCLDLGIEEGYVNISGLKRHLRATHKEEYEEDCRRFNPSSSFCPKCKKGFPNEDHVKIHMKKWHLDD